MKSFKLFTAAVILFAAVAGAEPTVAVTNLQAEQRADTNLIDIYFDMETTITDGRQFPVVLLFGEDPNDLAVAEAVTGDVAAGENQHIVWDAGEDWPMWATLSMTLRVQVSSLIECPPGGDASAIGWDVVNSRWIRNYYADGSVTMTDLEKNLMWVYDANSGGTANWSTAKSRAAGLEYAGYSDWYLPDKNKLAAMYSQKSIFADVQNSRYWSSTPGYGDYYYAYYVNMSNGDVYYNGDYTVINYWVWSCRPGQ